jgi:hypothetical protein
LLITEFVDLVLNRTKLIATVEAVAPEAEL